DRRRVDYRPAAARRGPAGAAAADRDHGLEFAPGPRQTLRPTGGWDLPGGLRLRQTAESQPAAGAAGLIRRGGKFVTCRLLLMWRQVCNLPSSAGVAASLQLAVFTPPEANRQVTNLPPQQIGKLQTCRHVKSDSPAPPAARWGYGSGVT